MEQRDLGSDDPDELFKSALEADNQTHSKMMYHPLKDHCDYLMDSIDTQLNQIEISKLTVSDNRKPGNLAGGTSFRNTSNLTRKSGNLSFSQSGSRDTGLGSASAVDPLSDTEMAFSMIHEDANIPAAYEETKGSFNGNQDTKTSSPTRDIGRSQADVRLVGQDGVTRKQYEWRMQELLTPEQMENQGYQSDSNTMDSVRTEDYASRFTEGMVDSLLKFYPDPDSDESRVTVSSFEEERAEPTSLLQRSTCELGGPYGFPQGERLWQGPDSIGELGQQGQHLSADDGCCRIRPKTSGGIEPTDRLNGETKRPFISGASVCNVGDCAQGDGPPHLTVKRLDFDAQFGDGLENTAPRNREKSSAVALSTRAESVESLGGRISKFSQNNISRSQNSEAQERSLLYGRCSRSANPLENQSAISDGLPLRGEDRPSGGFPWCNPGLSYKSTEIKLKESLKRLSQQREKLSRDLNQDLQSSATAPPVTRQGLSIPCDRPLSSKQVERPVHNETVNRNRSPCPVTWALTPRHTESLLLSAGALPNPGTAQQTHTGDVVSGSYTSSQRKGYNDSLSISESQAAANKKPVSSPGSQSRLNPLWVQSSCKGSDVQPSEDPRCSETTSSSLQPREKRSLVLPDRHLTESIHPTKPHHRFMGGSADGSHSVQSDGSQPGLNGDNTHSKHTLVSKHVAGVPVTSFKEVGIDSDLDSAKTEKVQMYIRKALRSRNDLICPKSMSADDLHTDQSDLDSVKRDHVEKKLHENLRKRRIATKGGRSQVLSALCGSHVGKRSHSPRKDSSRYPKDEMKMVMITDEEEFEEFLCRAGNERRTSSADGRCRAGSRAGADQACGQHSNAHLSSSRKCPSPGRRLRHRPSLDSIRAEEAPLEKTIGSLQHGVCVEEEKLALRKVQLRDADQTLAEILQQKRHTAQEVQGLRESLERGRQDTRALESSLRETQSKTDEARTELVVLESRRDSYRGELQDLEDELKPVKSGGAGGQSEAKDEEMLRLKEQIQSRAEATKELSEKLKQEAKEMVQEAVGRERRKWETAQQEQLRSQRTLLEEEKRQALGEANEELERERRRSLGLQNQISDLQERIHQLGRQNCSLQRESQQAVGDVRATLEEAKQKEIRQLREDIELEKQEVVERLQSQLEQAGEQRRVLLGERSQVLMKERDGRAQAERAERSFVSEINAECDRIKGLIHDTQGRAVSLPLGTRGSPTTMTLGEALYTLHGVTEELHQHALDLHQELESQRRMAHHLRREKERELKQQQEQLSLANEEAVASLKDRLLQEHMKEIGDLQRSQHKERGGSEEHSLRQQLRDKDNELRAIQRNMTKWKDETAGHLARKFEEELTAELEKWKCELLKQRRLSKQRAEHQRKIEKLENEIQRLTTERGDMSHLQSASTPLMGFPAEPSFRQQDFGSLKLLRHLQSRVKQLRAENAIYHSTSLQDLSTLRPETGGPYRERNQVTPGRSLLRFPEKWSRK